MSSNNNSDDLLNPGSIPDGETPATLRRQAAQGADLDASEIELTSDRQTGDIQVNMTETAVRERAAEQSDAFGADDFRVADDGVSVRDQALKREAAAGTPYDPDDLSVEDGEVTTPEASPEKVDLTLWDRDDPSGDVTWVGPNGQRIDTGADAGAGEDPYFARVDVPDSEGQWRLQVGDETVRSVDVGPVGAARDVSSSELNRGWNGQVIELDEDAGTATASESPSAYQTASDDPDVVAGAGAAEALQAGVPVEDLSGAGPISEGEGEQIAQQVEAAERAAQQQARASQPPWAGKSDTFLAQRGSEANQALREEVASDREGLRPDEVDIVATDEGLAYQRDGALIGAEQDGLDFGGAPDQQRRAPTAPPADEVDFDEGQVVSGPQRISDPTEVERQTERVLENRGEVRAAVNRYGQRQLDAQDQSEQFGDIAVQNPATGNRVEDDLTSAADFIRGNVAGAAEFASRRDVPATGPFEPIGQARQIDTAAELLSGQSFDGEGPTERVAESATTALFGGALNPAEAAAEAKEIGEFAVTQPQRVGRAAAGGDDDSILPGLIGDAVDAGEGVARSEFARDVERRTGRIIAAAEEDVRERPFDTAGAAVGGVAGGVAAGAAVGRVATRLPGVSGSDLSGRALQSLARGGERGATGVRRLLSDDRAQADLTLGRQRDVVDDSVDDLPDEIAGTEPVPPEGPQRFADPSDALPDRGPDIDPSSRVRRVRDRTARIDEGRGDVLDPRDRDLAVRRSTSLGDSDAVTGRSVDVDAANDVLPGIEMRAAAAGAGVTVGGALGQSDAVAQETQQGDLLGQSDLADADAAVGPDVGGRLDTDVDGRVDITDRGRGDVDTRLDTRLDENSRLDTRLNNRLDTRFDTRQDTRADTRQDTRFDTRQDTRADVDTRADFRFDFRQDMRFDTPDEPGDDDERRRGGRFGFLIGERTFDSGIANAEQAIDSFFGNGGERPGGRERDLSADNVREFEFRF